MNNLHLIDALETSYCSTPIQGGKGFLHVKTSNTSKVIARPALPKTRYYGSKLRLIEWILSCVGDLNFNTALDVFGGTGTVSLMLKHLGKDVTYNDILMSNHYMAKSLLHQDRIFDKNEIIKLFQSVVPFNGFITKNFDNQYYYHEENRWLDGAIQAIHRMRNEQKKADSFYCLSQACLKKRPFNLFHRKNLYIRKNCDRKTSFGNWRTWEKSFLQHIDLALIELQKAKNISSGSAKVLQPTDASAISSGYDLVYIDPPYLKQKGSGNNLTYLDRYHFLEGMADYKNWESRIDFERKNFPLKPTHEISEWNHKLTFKGRLFDLITKHRNSIVILSYSTDGYPSTHELTSHFKKTFRNVTILQKKLSHALRKTENQEILIIGE